MTAEEIQGKIDELDGALANSVQSFTFADNSFTFRSVTEMQRQRAHFVALLASMDGAPVGYRLAATSKGV
jgi:hypothetical protein